MGSLLSSDTYWPGGLGLITKPLSASAFFSYKTEVTLGFTR